MKGFELRLTRRSSFLLRRTFPAKLGFEQTGFDTGWKVFVGGSLCYQTFWLCSQNQGANQGQALDLRSIACLADAGRVSQPELSAVPGVVSLCEPKLI